MIAFALGYVALLALVCVVIFARGEIRARVASWQDRHDPAEVDFDTHAERALAIAAVFTDDEVERLREIARRDAEKVARS